MAAARVFQTCARMLPNYCTLLRQNGLEKYVQKASILSSIRDYRGSYRDTRRRERNRQAKLRKREGTRLKVFDKKEFMAQNYEKELFAFKSRLQLNFQDESILLSALTHGSFEADQSEDQLTRCGEPNSKLALLGLSFMSRHITAYLFLKFPAMPVDGIRNLCNFLTNRETNVRIAEQFALPELIRIEHDLDTVNEEKHLGIRREDVISDALLSLIGAIYVDQGFEEAGKFVQDFIIPQMRGEELEKVLQFERPQTLLENLLQASGKEKPIARLIRESGSKTHLPVFVVAIYCGENILAEVHVAVTEAKHNLNQLFQEVLTFSHTLLAAASWNVEKATHEAMTAALIKFILHDVESEPKLPSMKESSGFSPTDELRTRLSL